MDNPSIGEANKVLRVLKGERLKFTIRVHAATEIIEFQSDKVPKLKFIDEDRCLWLVSGEYDNNPIMRWPEGGIVLSEENPKP